MADRKISVKSKWALGAVLGFLLVVAGAGTAYAAHFSAVALPGVTVGGHPVTGMTQEQVDALVSELANDTTLTVTVNGNEKVSSLADLGITVDSEATAKAALEPNSSVPSRFTALFGANDIPVIYQVDQEILNASADQVAALSGPTVQDGGVILAESGDYFIATEAAPGAGIDTKLYEASALLITQKLDSMSLELEATPVEPRVSTEQAQQLAAQANDLLQKDVVIRGTVSVNPASIEDLASWVVIPSSEEGLSTPVFDTDRVKEWVVKTAKSTEDAPRDGVQNVDSSGKVLATPDSGTSGWEVDNLDQITAAAVTALGAGESYDGQLTYREVAPGFEQRAVLPGSENLAYSPHAGQRWIDINLTNHTVSAYQGVDRVRGPIPMVDGMDELPTVTGTNSIYLKYDKQTMRVTNVDGSTYESPDVPWVSYFYAGYALHGAYWRSSFGFAGSAGSHGCVNMPVSEAKWFYDFADYGTAVVSHY